MKTVSIFVLVVLLAVSPGSVQAEEGGNQKGDQSSPESGLAVLSDGGVDQVNLFTDDYDEEVIVIEEPVIRRQVGRTMRGFPIEIVELKRRVSYVDLDLSKEADVTAFEQRTEVIAKRACEEIAHRHTFEIMDKRAITRCTKEAVEQSGEQMQAAIAAAHS